MGLDSLIRFNVIQVLLFWPTNQVWLGYSNKFEDHCPECGQVWLGRSSIYRRIIKGAIKFSGPLLD
jgi:hypothetical protein